MKRFITLIAATMFLYALAVPAYATLIDKGNGLIYDDDFNITWLQDANYSGVTMTWADANTWASDLVFQGFDDWRLPISDTCSGNTCTGSEMGHLFYTEGITSSSNGLFQNVKPSLYWAVTEYDNAQSWRFNFLYGTQSLGDKTQKRYAWAVRNGDVTPPVAPEPVSSILFVTGGMVLSAKLYRKKRRNFNS